MNVSFKLTEANRKSDGTLDSIQKLLSCTDKNTLNISDKNTLRKLLKIDFSGQLISDYYKYMNKDNSDVKFDMDQIQGVKNILETKLYSLSNKKIPLTLDQINTLIGSNIEESDKLDDNVLLSYSGRMLEDLRNILTTGNIESRVANIEKNLNVELKYKKRVCTSLSIDSNDTVNREFLKNHKTDLLQHIYMNVNAWSWCIIFNHTFTNYLNNNDNIIIKKDFSAPKLYTFANYKTITKMGISKIEENPETKDVTIWTKLGRSVTIDNNNPNYEIMQTILYNLKNYDKINNKKSKSYWMFGAFGKSYQKLIDDYFDATKGYIPLNETAVENLYLYIIDQTLGIENETALFNKECVEIQTSHIAGIVLGKKFYENIKTFWPNIEEFTEDLLQEDDSNEMTNLEMLQDYCNNNQIPCFVINTIKSNSDLIPMDKQMNKLRQTSIVSHAHTTQVEELSNFYRHQKINYSVNSIDYPACSVEAAYGQVKLNYIKTNYKTLVDDILEIVSIYNQQLSRKDIEIMVDNKFKISIDNLQEAITGDAARNIGHNWPSSIVTSYAFKNQITNSNDRKLISKEIKRLVSNWLSTSSWNTNEKFEVMQQLLISKYNNVRVFRKVLFNCKGNYIIHSIAGKKGNGRGGDEWAQNTNYLGNMLTLLEDNLISCLATNNEFKPYTDVIIQYNDYRYNADPVQLHDYQQEFKKQFGLNPADSNIIIKEVDTSSEADV